MSHKIFKPSVFGHETHRLLALTDGVFSIVMTLMVFNLSLPKDRPARDLTDDLYSLWPNFLAYFMSFGLVGIYWSAHHSMFRLIRRTSLELAWLNILFLACVSLLPFSTSVLASRHAEPASVRFYGLNLVLIGLALLPIWRHATYHRLLVDEHLPDSLVRYGYCRTIFATACYSIGTLLAFANTTVSIIIFATLPIMYILTPVQHFWARSFHITIDLESQMSERA